MKNPYIIQAVGLAISAIGVLALIAVMTIYGRPLSDDERLRLGRENRGEFKLPINIETIFAAIIFLSGVGILYWSKFELCTFTAHWVPNLPGFLMSTIHC